jgi:hypothetical protein
MEQRRESSYLVPSASKLGTLVKLPDEPSEASLSCFLTRQNGRIVTLYLFLIRG